MPNALRKRGRGYGVFNKAKGKWHSRKPMTKKNAQAQLAIIAAADAGHPFTGKASKWGDRRGLLPVAKKRKRS